MHALRVRNRIARQFLSRVRDSRVTNLATLGNLSAWIESHTFLNMAPFSFRQHEFQRAIVDDTSTTIAVMKPSQCGLSEVSSRQTLAFLAVHPGCVSIYGLQTVLFSSRFFKSRIDRCIYESKYLRELILPAADSASFKQFTNGSQLHGAGFSAGVDVISIPASTLTIDELDRCDMESVATGESRLSHSPFVDPETGVRGVRRYFSTPTVTGHGVSAMFDKSDQKRRLVRCKNCYTWSWPSLLEQGVVQGWDKPLTEITSVDVMQLDQRGLLKTAKLLCPSCHHEITPENLRPQYREWVAERPHITRISGWAVSPHDLPDYHTPESLLRKLVEFGDHHREHWVNFGLGLPYETALNSVKAGVIDEHTVIPPISPEQARQGAASGCVFGLDVGRISWAVIAKPIGDELHILHLEQIRLRRDDGTDLVDRVLELLRAYRVVAGLCDNLPFTDSILEIIAHYPALRGVEYSLRDKALPLMVESESGGEDVVRMNRTKVLSYLVKRVNSGKIKFPMGKETGVLKAHLHSLKQVERDKGAQEWIHTGPDHYAHALNYAHMAAYSFNQALASTFAPAPTIKQVIPSSKFRLARVA